MVANTPKNTRSTFKDSPAAFILMNIPEVSLAPLVFFDVLDAYYRKKNLAMWSPNGYVYSYNGELGLCVSLDIGGYSFLFFAKDKLSSGAISIFEPTIITRRFNNAN